MLPVVIFPGNLNDLHLYGRKKRSVFSFTGGIEAILADKADVRHNWILYGLFCTMAELL
jgi:hypothetical protein